MFESTQVRKDIYVLFQDLNQIAPRNLEQYFSIKNFYFILNKDLKKISRIFFVNTFKVGSLKNAALVYLLSVKSNSYVANEFGLTISFIKRLETLHKLRTY